MIESSEAQKRVEDNLIGFPPQVTAAYLAFAEDGEPGNLDVVVLGVLQFCLAKKPARPLAAMPGSTRLVEDLGCDSLTIMDLVFRAECLFDIDIDDGNLGQIATLDGLRDHLQRLVLSPVAPGA